MIEYIVIGAVVWTFASGILPILCTMLRVDDDPYIPSREYADDFAAHLSGKESPGSAPSLAGEQPADPGDDIIDFRKLGTGPRGILQTSRTTPITDSLGRSAAETDRPHIYLVP